MTRPSDDFIDPALLERFLSRTCTAEEGRLVEQWMAVNPLRAAIPGHAWSDPASGTASEVDAIWAEVRHRIVPNTALDAMRETTRDAARIGTAPKPASRFSRAWRRPLGTQPSRMSLMLGALAIGGAAAGAIMVMVRGGTPHAASAPARTYTTAPRQRATITLADGSRVTLAPHTTLTVSGDFGSDSRNVALRGEAYFNVVPAPGAPFTVQAGDVRTQVLGTAFAVRRYPSDRETCVAVVSGKVAVNTVAGSHAVLSRPTVTLSAGMVGVVTDSSVVATSVRDLTPYTGWVDGRLVLRDMPVSQALVVLGHWYGFEFRLHDTTLAARHLTDTFEPDNSAEMLTALKAILDVDLIFDDTVVTVRPRRSAARKAPPRATERQFVIPQPEREVGRQ